MSTAECTIQLSAGAFTIAPNSQPKSPARQQCEANATASYNNNIQTAKQSILPHVVGGAIIAVAFTPVAACAIGAVVGFEAGPPGMAAGCGIGFYNCSTSGCPRMGGGYRSHCRARGLRMASRFRGLSVSPTDGGMRQDSLKGTLMSVSRDELKMTIVAKIAGGGRRKFFKYVWTVTTIFCGMLMNVLLRREVIASSLAGPFVVVCGETFILIVSAFAGFFYTRVLWLHFTKWYPEGNRPKYPPRRSSRKSRIALTRSTTPRMESSTTYSVRRLRGSLQIHLLGIPRVRQQLVP